ncbi:unnamed protein product [Nezara viridula]|uniref:Peptidase S8/S53 domain-containing protein n=1 Tax=Nezara viridula TaxID=85310 RepID=A0A9P0MRL4_NEZVI|nr:unnamed protein product [Nezara viridula]
MWYLNRGSGLDMSVEGAWKEGITGKGIVVTILDDGLEKDHPDLKENYYENLNTQRDSKLIGKWKWGGGMASEPCREVGTQR